MAEGKFEWGLYPRLEEFVKEQVSSFLTKNEFARDLSTRMLEETSTRFTDWIDHIAIPATAASAAKLSSIGLAEESQNDAVKGVRVFRHSQSYLFPFLLRRGGSTEIALKPENIEDFAQAIGTGPEIIGEPFSRLRKAIISKEGSTILSAVERRGYGGYLIKESDDRDEYLSIMGAFFGRRRLFESDEEGMEETGVLVSESARRIGGARASDAFFRAERTYWQRRNRAGQTQKARQDRLGLGWGNHDHHTYRSSRKNFSRMIGIFEKLGYACREKYYAGEKAGWGAQILEHSECGIVVFTDVDLWPEETRMDFSHKGLRPRGELGTVGLWVGLHGESILQAGMHHLEARFDHDKLSTDLQAYGLKVMPPFSYFDFLKQAFTQGERWKVDGKRLDALLSASLITKEQHSKFSAEGAIGSHMENLERDQGFKGFNRSSVTKIIRETDPRKQRFTGA